jgi:putative transposase
MAADPGQYRWSSYRANGLGMADARLTPHAVYLAQGHDDKERMAAYRSLFRPQLDAEAAADIRQALQLGMPVGNDRFTDAICAKSGVRRNSGKRGRPPGEVLHEPARLDGQRSLEF